MNNTAKPRCFFFGCWNQSGHYLFAPGGRRERSNNGAALLGNYTHIDGALAPRYGRGGALCWKASHPDGSSAEYPQGRFLRHVLDNGFTALQWWDQTQGDTRPGSNSTLLLEGDRTTEECLAALREHFPHVVENLKRAGVELVEVKRG